MGEGPKTNLVKQRWKLVYIFIECHRDNADGLYMLKMHSAKQGIY